MKKLIALTLIFVTLLALAGCGGVGNILHKHTWKEATCTEPKTCTGCGETEGEPLGHEWTPATCEDPETCSRCGATQGKAKGHVWGEATCQHPATCSVCGEEKDNVLGDHVCSAWSEIVEPTCTEEGYRKGVCDVCGKELEEVLEKIPHDFGDWKVKKKAEYGKDGLREHRCLVCKTLESEEFSFSDTVKDKVEFTSAPDGVKVEDARVIYKKSFGFIFYQVLVEISNDSGSAVELSNGTIDLIDKDSNVLKSINEYSTDIAPSVIEPGQKGYILAYGLEKKDELNVANGMDILVRVTAKKASGKTGSWEFSDLVTKGGNFPNTTGTLTNTGSKTVTSCTVICVYRDKSGRVIGFSQDMLFDDIPAGGSAAFETISLANGLFKSGSIASVECYCTER